MINTIESVINTYEKALNGNDINTILSLYGSNPIFMPQHSKALEGRDAIRAGYAHVFSEIKLNIAFTIHDVEVIGDTAWARTSSVGKTLVLAPGITVSESNNELFIFRKEKGEWLIHQYLFSTTEPKG
jgi:uncharacterized protein (TIGR02246 family)